MKLKKCLDDGSSHNQDIMFNSLRELLESKNSMLDSEHLASFILKSRQMLENRCKLKSEEVLFFSFQKIDPLERIRLVQDINQKINQKVGFSPSTISKVLLLNEPHALSSEECLLLEKDCNFEFLSRIVKKIDPYEDVELTVDEVKQVFKNLEEFTSKIENPSPSLMIFFNDFLIRSCLNQGYAWGAY